jgi:hypothetical protein
MPIEPNDSADTGTPHCPVCSPMRSNDPVSGWDDLEVHDSLDRQAMHRLALFADQACRESSRWCEIGSLNRRYVQPESLQALTETVPTRLPAVARWVPRIQPVRTVDCRSCGYLPPPWR